MAIMRRSRRWASWSAAKEWSQRQVQGQPELAAARGSPLRPAGRTGHRNPAWCRLYRRLPYLGPELHHRIQLQLDPEAEPLGHAPAQPAYAGWDYHQYRDSVGFESQRGSCGVAEIAAGDSGAAALTQARWP